MSAPSAPPFQAGMNTSTDTHENSSSAVPAQQYQYYGVYDQGGGTATNSAAVYPASVDPLLPSYGDTSKSLLSQQLPPANPATSDNQEGNAFVPPNVSSYAPQEPAPPSYEASLAGTAPYAPQQQPATNPMQLNQPNISYPPSNQSAIIYPPVQAQAEVVHSDVSPNGMQVFWVIVDACLVSH